MSSPRLDAGGQVAAGPREPGALSGALTRPARPAVWGRDGTQRLTQTGSHGLLTSRCAGVRDTVASSHPRVAREPSAARLCVRPCAPVCTGALRRHTDARSTTAQHHPTGRWCGLQTASSRASERQQRGEAGGGSTVEARERPSSPGPMDYPSPAPPPPPSLPLRRPAPSAPRASGCRKLVLESLEAASCGSAATCAAGQVERGTGSLERCRVVTKPLAGLDSVTSTARPPHHRAAERL